MKKERTKKEKLFLQLKIHFNLNLIKDTNNTSATTTVIRYQSVIYHNIVSCYNNCSKRTTT